MQFRSPWLDFQKPSWPRLQKDLNCEVAIVGAGISGVATLYFLLTCTNKKAFLIEKGTVASGATGHSAGLAVSYIERPLTELIQEFGAGKTKEAYDEIDTGWDILYEIHEKIGLKDNIVSFDSSAMGIATVPLLLHTLRGEKLKMQIGRPLSKYLVVDDEEIRRQIPPELQDLVKYVPQEEILQILKVVDTSYIAAATRSASWIARLNTAKFCYEVLRYLQQKFADRFSVYENTEVLKISLHEGKHILEHNAGKVHAEDVILCTNGYIHVPIFDHKNKQKITKLEQMIAQREGFLAAYPNSDPESFNRGFLHDGKQCSHVPYWYISQGPFMQQGSFTSIGGPEYTLDSPASSELIDEYAMDSKAAMNHFIQNTLDQTPLSFTFFWHGVMGYTSNGLRWVGQDPDHPHLWYNLGCNGIGIIPALSGAKRLARQLNGEVFTNSLFDPPK